MMKSRWWTSKEYLKHCPRIIVPTPSAIAAARISTQTPKWNKAAAKQSRPCVCSDRVLNACRDPDGYCKCYHREPYPRVELDAWDKRLFRERKVLELRRSWTTLCAIAETLSAWTSLPPWRAAKTRGKNGRWSGFFARFLV